jgi:hypothetical protein
LRATTIAYIAMCVCMCVCLSVCLYVCLSVCPPRFEGHYNSVHRHVCSVCRRTLPSNHLLDIHLLENHDAMFQLQTAKQDMVSTSVSGVTSNQLSKIINPSDLINRVLFRCLFCIIMYIISNIKFKNLFKPTEIGA